MLSRRGVLKNSGDGWVVSVEWEPTREMVWAGGLVDDPMDGLFFCSFPLKPIQLPHILPLTGAEVPP